MKQITFSLLLIVLFFTACHRNIGRRAVPEYDYYVNVVGITDGDTFKGLTRDKKEIRFRIHGIDAPEKRQPFSQRSKQYLSDLIYGETVGIIVEKDRDRYGRPVVWVYTPDGKDVSAEMIKAGMAWHYKDYSDDEKYALLEIEAQENRLGLWSDPNPVMPSELRKNQRRKR